MDLGGLATRGYTVSPAVAPEPLLAAARDAITAFLGVDLHDPARWYPREPLEWGVVPVHHAQALWDLRQLPAVHRVFAAIRGTERLWVSMDRAVYKVPARPDHPDDSRMHWDLDPRTLAHPSYQGMLFLTDSTDGRAPFACLPSVFATLDAHLAAHDTVDPLDPTGHDVVEVPVRAGDLVVWDSRLPHHGGPNRGRSPRVSVAIAMWPEGDDAERARRIELWQTKRPPECWRGWRGQVDPEPGDPATLDAHGRRLVGLDRW